MYFASPYVLNRNVEDESYEVVSDEEFQEGMDLSDSESETEDEPRATGPMAQAQAAPETKSDAVHGRNEKDKETEAPKDGSGPSLIGRLMGMFSSPPDTPPATLIPKTPPRASAACRGAMSARTRSTGKKHHWKSTGLPTTEERERDVTGGQKKRRVFRRTDTNIVSLRFDTLKTPSTMHAGEVIQCSNCEAVMSNVSRVEEDGPDKVWKCEFCGHRNLVDIEEEEKPTGDDVTYLVEAGPSTTASGTSGRDESIVIFCIDISGSMTITTEVPGRQALRGSATLRRLQRENTFEGPQVLPREMRNVTYISRLQAVQAAVDHQLGEMAKEFPHRRIGLVTFSNDVTVIGDGTGEEVTVSGQKLMNREELTKVGEELPSPKPIKEVRASLGDKIFTLEEGGSTALGPAIIVALSLASRHPGSKVILCTDGKSNEGVGKIENLSDSDPSPDQFFENVAATANAKGVSVSVITIKGTDCKLIQLGKLADSTGGQVNIVDPLKLTEEFSNVLADRIIATSVVATFILHRGLYIGQEENEACKERREIGNVKADHEISFEFGIRKRKAKAPPKPCPLDRISEVPSGMEVSSPRGEGQTKPGNDTPVTPEMEVEERDKTTATAKTPTETENNTAASTDTQAGAGNTAAATGETQAGAAGGAAADAGLSSAEDNIPSELPFQVQIMYTDVDGTKALRVLTMKKPVTSDRNVAERDIDFTVLGLHTERRSSELALQGDYTKSREVALMNQRICWRSSHKSNDEERKKAYRRAFTGVKTVENKVSKKQQDELVTYGRTHSDDEDEDSKEMIDSDFMRMGAHASAPVVPGLSQPMDRRKAAVKSFVASKKKSMRNEEVDDDMASMLYQARTTSVSSAIKRMTSTKSEEPKKSDDSDKKDKSDK